MKLIPFITPALYAVCATALPAKRDNGPFTAIALRSASPIHQLSITAAGESFWLGGNTASYCPTNVDPCPPGNVTVFGNAYSLDVEVPGGQVIYVNPSGALAFTMAHSIYIPSGSQQGPFSYDSGSPFGSYSTSSFGATGFMACPDDAMSPTSWQVFAAIQNATVPTGNVADCLGFDAATVDYDGDIPAWQYI
ncbi:hypothetical protein UA08_01319 [Talaromyces atroroseus]|uniref:IgE-binding protein n=1 Tax=Talaromyces atroroseus TaxID=1441469 RepID=A0A1Q5QBB8_TALAT|nr:hypothetical protein UA08_01319 [Talaromyces atroroseus]OKL63210.1 hypothetical protein UA08_01319 [Talaromyces atroroseus]